MASRFPKVHGRREPLRFAVACLMAVGLLCCGRAAAASVALPPTWPPQVRAVQTDSSEAHLASLGGCFMFGAEFGSWGFCTMAVPAPSPTIAAPTPGPVTIRSTERIATITDVSAASTPIDVPPRRIDDHTWEINLPRQLANLTEVTLAPRFDGAIKGKASYSMRIGTPPASVRLVRARRGGRAFVARLHVSTAGSVTAYLARDGRRRSAIATRVVAGAGTTRLSIALHRDAARTSRRLVVVFEPSSDAKRVRAQLPV